ncbi:MAG: GH3 auxin-responsive promoter family protein [Lachnospiraceae bacterium]|nr:GH3 auxin-responsive promoter family protein [Lachnospiraceae bacterium]
MENTPMTLDTLSEKLQAGEKDLSELLTITSKDAQKEQEAVLTDILMYAKDCEYGKQFGFADIDSYENYSKKVPITEFSDYHDHIERMKKAEENILFPGKASSFVVSTGTSGTPKYIPESKRGALVKSIVSRMRSYQWRTIIPEAERSERKFLPLVNAAVYEITEGGIPAGSASGLSSKSSIKVTRKAIPELLLTIPGLSRNAMDYLTLLFSLSEKEVAKLICNNVAHFNLLWQFALEKADMLIEDIRNGSMSIDLKSEDREALMKLWKSAPERADELQELIDLKGKWEIKDVWPHFEAVVCWIGGSVGRTAREFRSLFPEGTVFINWGYGASEGKFDVPVKAESTEGILTLFGYFYEFLKPGETIPVPLWEAVDNEPYELILSSYSGFYRYNIHDLVELKTSPEGLRTVSFLGKTSDSLELTDRKLFSGEFLYCIEQYEQANGVFFRLVQGKNEEGRLRILLENGPKDCDESGFEAWARDTFEKRGIPFAGITMLEKGYRDSLFEKVMESGKSVNSTKVAVFV